MAPANSKVAGPIPKPSSTNQGSKPPQKKRKKNAPDKPQPEWMFPPDEENPILNSKPKPDARVVKEQEEREAAIEFLHYKSVSTPKKPAPPGMLLTLVGAFLTSYGFDNASRLYTTQCKARKKLGAWDHELGVKLPKGMPSLEKIFKDWHKDYEQTRQEETSSSSNEASDSEARKLPKSIKTPKASNVCQTKEEQTSSSGSSNASSDTSSESDTKTAKIPDGKKGIKSSAKNKDVSESSSSSSSDSEAEVKAFVEVSKTARKPKKANLPSGSSSVSSSESDADDEKEAPGARVSSPKPTINALVNNLKRKADSRGRSSSDPTSSSSSSDDGDDEMPPLKKTKPEITENLTLADEPTAKKAKVNSFKASPINVAQRADTSSASSSESSPSDESPVRKPLPASSSSDSSSSSESEAPTPPIKSAKASKPENPKLSSESSKSTDSSATLEGTTSGKPSTSNTSSSSSKISAIGNEPAPIEIVPKAVQKRKRSPSPFSARAGMLPSKASKHKEGSFQRVPKDTKIDPKLASNKYISYDYAEQAHRDLSVTKGKGFTKEKNKKKRGSYRGGMIDVDGRKGIKFDD